MLFDSCPPIFRTLMNHFNSLKFEEAPNYALYKQLLLQTADEAGFNLFDNVFDW